MNRERRERRELQAGTAAHAGRDLPHPNLLPLGEGTHPPPSDLCPLISAFSISAFPTILLPLPAGEGWGEGEVPRRLDTNDTN